MCRKIWLERNQRIFKDHTPSNKIVLAKTWSMTNEFINSKGGKAIDVKYMQHKESKWL